MAKVLLDSTVSEADKLKFIRISSAKSADDKRGIAQRILDETHSLKVAIAFADFHKDFDFVKHNLLIAERNVCHHTLKYTWIYTEQYVANKDFIVNVLPLVSYAARQKIFNGLGKWLRDEKLADDFFKLAKSSFSTKLALMLLPACTEHLIKDEMEKGTFPTDSQLLEMFRHNFAKGKSITDYTLTVLGPYCYQNAVHFYLTEDFQAGFEALVKHDCSFYFGHRRTLRLVKHLIRGELPEKQIFEDKVVQFGKSLKKYVLAQKLPRDTFEKTYIRHVTDRTPLSLSYITMDCEQLNWIKEFPRKVQTQIMENLYLSKFGKRPVDVPRETFPEMFHLLSDEDRIKIIERHLANKETKGVREGEADRFWIAMKPPALAIEELKKLVNAETSSKKRSSYYRLMIASCIYSRDYSLLPDLMSYISKRTKNEVAFVRGHLISILGQVEIEYLIDIEDFWRQYREIIEVRLLKDKQIDYFVHPMVFNIAKHIRHSRSSLLQEMVAFLIRLKMDDVFYFAGSLFFNLNDSRGKIIFEAFSEASIVGIEKRLNETKKWKYGLQALNLLEAWRECKLKLDVYKYPRCHELLRATLFKRNESWMDGRQQLAMYFLKNTLSEEEKAKVEDVVECTPLDAKMVWKILTTEETPDIVPIMKWVSTERFDGGVAALKRLIDVTRNDPVAREKILMYCREQIQGTEKSKFKNGAFFLLALMMDTSEYLKKVEAYIPKDATIVATSLTSADLDRQIAICRSLRFLTDSSKAFDALSIFLKGDYLKYVLGAFGSLCSSFPAPVVIAFLEQKLIDCAVSVQKHIIRWYFAICGRSTAKRLTDILSNTNNGSIKKEVLKIVYDQYNESPEEIWPILLSCMTSVTPEDKQTFAFIFQDERIDAQLKGNAETFFEVLFKLTDSSKEIKETYESDIFDRATKIIQAFDNEYSVLLLRRALFCATTSASHGFYRYCCSFIMKSSITAADDVFINEFTKVFTCDDLSFVCKVAAEVGKWIFHEKAYEGETGHEDTIEKLIVLLMSKVEECFPFIVFLQICAVMHKVIPPKKMQEDLEVMDRQYVKDFLDGSAPVVAHWTERFSLLVFDIIFKQFKEVLDMFTQTRNPFSDLLRHQEPGGNRVIDLILFKCIPNDVRDNKDENKNEYEAIKRFEKAIFQSQDSVVKILSKHVI